MSLYEQLKPLMDAQVDTGLGDSITYKINGVPVESAPGVPTIPAFLGLFGDDGSAIEGITPQVFRWRLKVHKQYMPAAGPSMRHTVEAAKLGGKRYRPLASNLTDDGVYWICDLQEAP